LEKRAGHNVVLNDETIAQLRRRFHQGSYRASAIGHSPVRSVRVDLVALVFSFLQVRRQHNAAACGVRLQRVGSGRRIAHFEYGLQHFDNVVEAMLFVVQNDDVIELAQIIFGSTFGIGV